MNKIIYLLFAIVLFSCKSNSMAQEKETEKTELKESETGKPTMEKPKVQKPKFGDTHTQDYIDPNTVHLTGVVLGTSKNANVCGKTYKATLTIKVKVIKNSGSGIVNMISSGQDITLAFRDVMVKDFDALKLEFGTDQEVSLLIKESLCPDMSQTVYEIIRSIKN